MNILLTNDDGILAVGLRAMYKGLVEAGHNVDVVAPLTEQSAVGHAVTLAAPLRVKEFKEANFQGRGVSGTPVDCVKLALASLLDYRPDVVVSGINAGCNVGIDIVYSGTVSAATEGAFAQVPALAVSYDGYSPTNLEAQAAHAADLLKSLPFHQMPPHCVLNLNYPSCPVAEARPLRVCPHTTGVYKDEYVARKDPRGHDYYWLAGEIPAHTIAEGTDKALLNQGHITLTPLTFDFTDRGALSTLEQSFPPLTQG